MLPVSLTSEIACEGFGFYGQPMGGTGSFQVPDQYEQDHHNKKLQMPIVCFVNVLHIILAGIEVRLAPIRSMPVHRAAPQPERRLEWQVPVRLRCLASA
jgi:hypothetical protein